MRVLGLSRGRQPIWPPADGRRLAPAAAVRLRHRAGRARAGARWQRPVRRRTVGDLAELDRCGAPTWPCRPTRSAIFQLLADVGTRPPRRRRTRCPPTRRCSRRCSAIALRCGRRPVRVGRRPADHRSAVRHARPPADSTAPASSGGCMKQHTYTLPRHHLERQRARSTGRTHLRHGRRPAGRQAHPLANLQPGDILFWSISPNGVLHQLERPSTTPASTWGTAGRSTATAAATGSRSTTWAAGAGWYHDAFAFGWRVCPSARRRSGCASLTACRRRRHPSSRARGDPRRRRARARHAGQRARRARRADDARRGRARHAHQRCRRAATAPCAT